MHAAVPLPCGDYFLVRDAYALVCATRVVKKLTPRRLASVYDDPARLRADLTIPQPHDTTTAGSPV